MKVERHDLTRLPSNLHSITTDRDFRIEIPATAHAPTSGPSNTPVQGPPAGC